MSNLKAASVVAAIGGAVVWSPSVWAIPAPCTPICLIEEEHPLTDLEATSPALFGAQKIAMPAGGSSVDTTGSPGTVFFAYGGLSVNVNFALHPQGNAVKIEWDSPQALVPMAGFKIDAGFTLDIGQTVPFGELVHAHPGITTFGPILQIPGDGFTVPDEPLVNLSASTISDPSLEFLITAATVTTLMGEGNILTTRDYFEYPISTSGAELTFDNPTLQSETLSDAGFFLSSTEIPLDQLNSAGLPPDDPRFQRVPNIPNGTVLGAGASMSFSIPEPAGATLLLTGISALLGCGVLRRLRRSRRDTPPLRQGL